MTCPNPCPCPVHERERAKARRKDERKRRAGKRDYAAEYARRVKRAKDTK